MRIASRVHVEFALEPLLPDLHEQQAEEAATEPEAERDRGLGLEDDDPGNPWRIVRIYARSGRRDDGFNYVRVDPPLDSVHEDGRWRELLRLMNLPLDDEDGGAAASRPATTP